MMTAVVESSAKVEEINNKISDSTKEAADSIKQISIGIDQISNVVQNELRDCGGIRCGFRGAFGAGCNDEGPYRELHAA